LAQPCSATSAAATPAACPGRESRAHDAQRRAGLLVGVGQTSGGEQVRRVAAREAAQRDWIGSLVGRIDERALEGLAVVPFDAPGAESDGVVDRAAATMSCQVS
jgi:hypothetical protein